MFASLIAAVSLVAQDPTPPQTPSTDPVIRLEDVVIDGRRLEAAAEAYVDQVAAPANRRGLARWDEGVCVGVANLQPELAQYVADRVSDVVRSVGLRAHEPPCHPSVLIIAISDASRFTEAFVAQRPRLFRVGGTGMDRGSAELRDFINEDRPVRWWHVSIPVDSETGDVMVRLPGYIAGSGAAGGREDTAQQYAPITAVHAASRLTTQSVDVLKRVFIIVDVDRLDGASPEQLADYLALVALAQIDPDGDTGRFDTILNLFDDPSSAPAGLTGWDRAYLDGLYAAGSETHRINQRAQVQAVADAITHAYRDGQAEDETAEEAPQNPPAANEQ